jgi:hypothetical protein
MTQGFYSPVYVFNTETNRCEATDHFDHYYFVAAGFFDLFTIKNYNAEITYYDFNQNALDFKHALLNHWNCTKQQLWDMVRSMKCTYTLGEFDIESGLTHKELFDRNWERICQDDWLEQFELVQRMHCNFVKFDVVEQSLHQLVPHDDQKKFMWISNCFEYEHNGCREKQRTAYVRFADEAQQLGMFVHGIDPLIDEQISKWL